MDAGFFLVKIL